MRPSTLLFAFRNFHFLGVVLTLRASCPHHARLALNNALQKQRRTGPMQQVETREWWLWGFAVTVTLVLTVGIVSLTFPGNHFLRNSDWLDLREWVRGLACLVLMFDIYTVYQQL